MHPAIEAHNISKCYTLHRQGKERYTALRDVISNKVKGIVSSSVKEEKTEEFWALKDLTFTINQGERVGIIGRNGAGKSTLLKVLSRIVSPTRGTAIIEGRVGSLLEVGTGFHPELSGRENIFLNGSILGMTRNEIKSKFDEIVDFAEVERFLDTPVKRYSSGMYVRLAFSVAAHLEPEILIVDEVLAVGDAQFQRKCLGKMKDVAGSGRTILFVSHNMAAIQALCDKSMYLRNGELVEMGNTADVISTYLRASDAGIPQSLADRINRQGNGTIRFTDFSIQDQSGAILSTAQTGANTQFVFKFERHTKEKISNLHLAIGIDDEFGQRICHFSNEVTSQVFEMVQDEENTIRITVPRLPLNAGLYTITLYSTVNGEIADYIMEATTFQVESGDFFLTGKLPPAGQGNFFIDHSFSLTNC